MSHSVSIQDPTNNMASSFDLTATTLGQNPFYILKATTRDNRHRIVELFDDAILEYPNNALCVKSRTDLTNPRNRLTSEMAWFPGISPKRVQDLLRLLSTEPQAVYKQNNLSPLAFTNLLATALELFGSTSKLEFPANEWILLLANAVEEIDVDTVLRDINEDREVAGFPEVKTPSLIEEGLVERKLHYKKSVKDFLNKLESNSLVAIVTEVVDHTTENGTRLAPELINELVDSYELETQGFLNDEAENVRKIIETIRIIANKGETAVCESIQKLSIVIKNWDAVAQPIQLSMTSRGLTHQLSEDLAYVLRSLAVDLYNDYGMLNASENISKLSQEVFAELPEFVEKVNQDVKTLEGLREKSLLDEKKWAQNISIKAELGLFKSILAISPSGLQWKNTIYPIDSVSRVRWGATSHYVNGIPTGTSYNICFGDQYRITHVDLKDKAIYSKFIDKLWNAVGYKLFNEILVSLKNGKRIQFGDVLIDDNGAEITKHGFFSNSRVYGNWISLKTGSADGCLVLEMVGDRKAHSNLSYQDVDNVHILDVILSSSYKKGYKRLSQLLD